MTNQQSMTLAYLSTVTHDLAVNSSWLGWRSVGRSSLNRARVGASSLGGQVLGCSLSPIVYFDNRRLSSMVPSQG